jgi:hypothetical protein
MGELEEAKANTAAAYNAAADYFDRPGLLLTTVRAADRRAPRSGGE